MLYRLYQLHINKIKYLLTCGWFEINIDKSIVIWIFF